MMKQLTGKIMEEKLKIGWTTTDFAQFFDVTEEEFLNRLNKAFTEKACADILRRLKRNDKFHRKACLAVLNRKKIKSNPQNDVKSSDFLSGEEDEKTETSTYLENLEKTEHELSDLIIGLESEHKALFQKRNCLAKDLMQEKQVLLDFVNKLSKHKETILKIIADCQDLTSKMHEKMINISTKRQELESIRSEIKELKKIQIFFYENGEIEFLNGESKIPDEAIQASDNLFNQLVSNHLLENATVKTIKQLSCLISITRYMSEQQFEFNITFEDSEIEKIFENISSNYQTNKNLI